MTLHHTKDQLGLMYQKSYLKDSKEKQLWLDWLSGLHPLWEARYSHSESDRKLLRPVYWYGNWQFAQLGYFQLPDGTQNRCVQAESFPTFVKEKLLILEENIKRQMPPAFVPRKWYFNTLLINYYGHQMSENGQKVDQARLGEHKDHEPGPVASLSLGAKTLFQFVRSQGREAKSVVVYEKWLEDNSLLVFAGEKFKNRLFHRVQRVDRKLLYPFAISIPNYEVRRINLTFRYVPDEFVIPFRELPQAQQNLIKPYLSELAKKSDFYKDMLPSAVSK